MNRGDLPPSGDCQKVRVQGWLYFDCQGLSTFQESTQVFAKYLFLINYTSNVFPSPIREGRYGRKGWRRKTQRKVGDGKRGEERKDSDTGTSVGSTQPRRNVQQAH